MIRIAIAGYGNIGKGVEYSVEQNKDMELVAIFSKRDPSSVRPRTKVPVVSFDEMMDWTDKVDVLILCGGSMADLPVQGPELAKFFNTVDSFDTHADIPKYFAAMDDALKGAGKLGLISAGWDPGLFSLNRLYMSAVLPKGETYTFWGRGISQGHSNAIRQVEGVLDGVQYTCPMDEAVEKVRSGSMPMLTTAEKHLRECFVVLKDGADSAKVEAEIVGIPNYFAEYKTVVHFISLEELHRDHGKMSHGGFVIRSGKTGQDNTHLVEYSLKLDSNAEFTSNVLAACARAVYRMAAEGRTGAISMFDVAPAQLSEKSAEELRAEVL